MNVLCRPYFKIAAHLPTAARARAAGVGPWAVGDLCVAYGWPTGLAGGGTIAIVELGGGWLSSDVQAFASANNLPLPSITDVSVDGTQNAPGKSDADVEVALDIQVAWAAYYAATGKAPNLRVYWANDIAPAIRAAIKDGCDVCSISWGADEANWGPAAAQDLEAAAQEAAAAGMIVFAASGDNDSSDGGPNAANVDLPAAAPHVVGCGGTTKTRSSETVWNDAPGSATGDGTGGGYSTLFPMPAWQSAAPQGPGRMVPDVAACADPGTGYEIVSGGQAVVVGGTSAVAPLYAGLFAAFGQKLGFVTDKLWANGGDFTDITSGDNGQYHAATGPDPCTGLGAPIGQKLAALLATGAAAPGPTAPPPSGPAFVPIDPVIAWAESALPRRGFLTPQTARRLIERGLRGKYPAG